MVNEAGEPFQFIMVRKNFHLINTAECKSICAGLMDEPFVNVCLVWASPSPLRFRHLFSARCNMHEGLGGALSCALTTMVRRCTICRGTLARLRKDITQGSR